MNKFGLIGVGGGFALAILLVRGNAGRASAQELGTPEPVGITYKAQAGLHVPPDTAEFIGLTIAEVEERRIDSALAFTAQVFRAGEGETTARASGLLSPSQARLARHGQAVKVTAGGVTMVGRILKELAGQEGGDGMVEVLVELEKGDQTLKLGTFVTVNIPSGTSANAVAVPKSALLRTAEGNFVYTVSGDRFVRTAVTSGVVNGTLAEITDGLYAGDRVVVNPVMALWMAELQSIRGGKACADGH